MASERNRVHQLPSISRPRAMCCAVSPADPSSTCRVSAVYRAAGGAVGRVKSGPTAQPPKPKAQASTIARGVGAHASSSYALGARRAETP